MVHLQLKPNEAEMLLEVLESDLSELRMEIADTDSREFRERLKDRNATLKGIVEALAKARESTPA